MRRQLRMHKGKYRLLDMETGEPATVDGRTVDEGGWDDWIEARRGRDEAEYKVDRHMKTKQHFVDRARARFEEAQARLEKWERGGRHGPKPAGPAPEDRQMLEDERQFGDDGRLKPGPEPAEGPEAAQ